MADEAESSGLCYKIDASRGSFTAQAFVDGMLSFMGHNPTFAFTRYGGEIQLTPNNTSVGSFLLVAQAGKLSLVDKVSGKDATEIEDAMRDEVLEVSRYSEITFVSKNVSMKPISGEKYGVQLQGFLTLHGETREKIIKAEAEISGKTIRATGKFNLKQSDFKIKRIKAIGGTLKVKDEVEISFDITAEI